MPVAQEPVLLAHHREWHHPPGHEKKHHHHENDEGEIKKTTTVTTTTVTRTTGTAATGSNAVRTICGNCGVIQMVNTVVLPAGTTGVGAVAGAVVGGVIGNQIGGGDGKKLATVAGVVGGGVIGNEIEKKNSSAQTVYDIKVKMDDGSVQTLRVNEKPSWRKGEKVILENGAILRRK